MVTEANDGVLPKLSTTAVLSPITSGGGLIVSIKDVMRSFLNTSSTSSLLSENLRHLSSSLSLQSTASYQSLRTIWFGSESGSRPDLSSLLVGSNFVFTSPAPRQKSEELKSRLRKQEESAERKAYRELVKDITPKKPVNEPFSSYKDQLGFGLHVVVTMFTGYLVGYAAFRALFGQSPPMSAAGGILGLVGAMLVETLLFILRYSDLGGESSSSSSTSRPSSLKDKEESVGAISDTFFLEDCVLGK